MRGRRYRWTTEVDITEPEWQQTPAAFHPKMHEEKQPWVKSGQRCQQIIISFFWKCIYKGKGFLNCHVDEMACNYYSSGMWVMLRHFFTSISNAISSISVSDSDSLLLTCSQSSPAATEVMPAPLYSKKEEEKNSWKQPENTVTEMRNSLSWSLRLKIRAFPDKLCLKPSGTSTLNLKKSVWLESTGYCKWVQRLMDLNDATVS